MKQAVSGVQRQRTELPHRKLPITVDILKAIFQNLYCTSDELREVFWTACLVAFYFLLRSSNLFMSNLSQSASYLKRADVRSLNGSAVLSVTVLKSNRFLGQKILLPLPVLPNHNVSNVSHKGATALVKKNSRATRAAAF